MERIVSFGFLAPPTILITLCVVGALIALRWRLVGLALVLVSSLTLFAFATPAVSSWLLRRAETGVPRQVDFQRRAGDRRARRRGPPGETGLIFPTGSMRGPMSAWRLPPMRITSCICLSRLRAAGPPDSTAPKAR